MSVRKIVAGLLTVLAGVAAVAGDVSAAGHAQTRRVSVSSAGVQADSDNLAPVLSARRGWVAFESRATNLVAGDTNGVDDVMVRNLKTNQTQRVSVSSAGAQADGASDAPAISATGRFVAFSSDATDLVDRDTNGAGDIFVRDLKTNQTQRVSVSSGGAQGDGASGPQTAISADGRFVAFASDATNLVAGDTNGAADVFVRDLKTSKTRRVSLGSNGAQGHGSSGPSVAIAANGRYVAFDSAAANLVRGDTNKAADLFVRDLKTNATQRVSLNSKGAQANRASDSPAVSASGRFVAFHSQASNLGGGGSSPGGEIFVRDRKKKKTRIVSVSNAGVRANQDSTGAPAISSDGRFVAFFSAAELVGADTNGVEDVFVRDLKTNKTSRVSANSAGTIGNGSSQAPSISGDAVLVAFESTATNFVSGDTNDAFDIFTRGPLR